MNNQIGRKHELSEMLQTACDRSTFTNKLGLMDLARLLANEDVANLDELKERLKKCPKN